MESHQLKIGCLPEPNFKPSLKFSLKFSLRNYICFFLTFLIAFGSFSIGLSNQFSYAQATEATASSVYQYRSRHDRDGIGKFYMEREIAQVMGHQGAGWLERSQRQQEERPDQAIALLKLKPDDLVADIGSGTGYFSLAIAAQLSSGRVYAVDLQPEMLEIMGYLQTEKAIKNVIPVLGTAKSPNLPDQSIDLAILVDAYHEFDYPQEMLQAIAKALKPQGRLALLEYKAENPFVAIKPLHKMSQNQVKKELASEGFKWLETQNLPQQHLIIFAKPAAKPVAKPVLEMEREEER
jgi:ubiquinone/menaquinone biosynthesis C-methylase UbiE